MVVVSDFDGQSIRKIRLLCAALCRNVRHLLHDERYRAALQTIEDDPAFVFDSKHKADLRGWLFELQAESLPYTMSHVARPKLERMQALPVYHAALAAWNSIADAEDEGGAVWDLKPSTSVQTVGRLVASACAIEAVRTGDSVPDEKRRIKSERAQLEACILGNPFQPVAFLPEWRTSTVVSLAKSMYESRDFAPMPLLADALQDAGCEHTDILDHCRGTGPHVRGCWVVDGVLEKS